MRKLTKIWAALFLFAGLGGVRAEVANPPTEFPEAPAESADEVLALHSSHYGVTDGIKDILDNSAAKVGSVKDVEGRQMISIENALNSWVHINFNKTIDISTYGTLHMDVYVVKGAFDCKMQFASNTANVFLSSEKLAEGWNRVVLNLADFTNAVNPADLTQVKEIALINNGGYARTIYVDNIYVSGKTGDTPLDPEMPAEMAPAPHARCRQGKVHLQRHLHKLRRSNPADGHRYDENLQRVGPAENHEDRRRAEPLGQPELQSFGLQRPQPSAPRHLHSARDGHHDLEIPL